MVLVTARASASARHSARAALHANQAAVMRDRLAERDRRRRARAAALAAHSLLNDVLGHHEDPHEWLMRAARACQVVSETVTPFVADFGVYGIDEATSAATALGRVRSIGLHADGDARLVAHPQAITQERKHRAGLEAAAATLEKLGSLKRASRRVATPRSRC